MRSRIVKGHIHESGRDMFVQRHCFTCIALCLLSSSIPLCSFFDAFRCFVGLHSQRRCPPVSRHRSRPIQVVGHLLRRSRSVPGSPGYLSQVGAPDSFRPPVLWSWAHDLPQDDREDWPTQRKEERGSQGQQPDDRVFLHSRLICACTKSRKESLLGGLFSSTSGSAVKFLLSSFVCF